MKHRVKVECRIVVEIEVDNGLGSLEFQIEDNGCPGTGQVGEAIRQAIESGDEASTCWACALQGTNRILEIDGVPTVRRERYCVILETSPKVEYHEIEGAEAAHKFAEAMIGRWGKIIVAKRERTLEMGSHRFQHKRN